MRDSLAASLGSELLADPPSPVRVANSQQPPTNMALLEVLRQSLEDASQPTGSILTAVADAARILSGADGTALALRVDGRIVCRSRSGSIAPALGSALNTESGISGECFRSATILVASDTSRDKRVDPEVCRFLGIRSIAAVPLRGPLGMAGILEAFSSRAGAFGNEQIDALRSLGEIAERAYEREQHPLQSLSTLGSSRNHIATAMGAGLRRIPDALKSGFSRKNYKIIAVGTIALLLIYLVVWSSWRQTQAEISAHELPSQASSMSNLKQGSLHPPTQFAPFSPARVATVRSSDSRPGGVLHKAAELSSAADTTVPSDEALSGIGAASAAPPIAKAVNGAAPDEAPPNVDLIPSPASDAFISVIAAPTNLPQFGGVTSQGLTEAKLLRKLDPEYPWRARLQRVEGSVTIDATVSPEGAVRGTKVVSGNPVLAESATAAVRHWRFSPATLDGNPIEVQMRVTVVFRLP